MPESWYPVVNDLIGGWAVTQSPVPMSQRPNGSQTAADHINIEAVAHIIAFALNAVAEGKSLVKLTHPTVDHPEGLAHPYDGPMDGVAPRA